MKRETRGRSRGADALKRSEGHRGTKDHRQRRGRRRTSAGGHVEAQPVAAGDVRDAELLDDPGGDGALAGGRRAQYDGPEGRRGAGGGATRGDRHHGWPAGGLRGGGSTRFPGDGERPSAAAISHRPRRTLPSIPTTGRPARGLWCRARAAIRPRPNRRRTPATRRDATATRRFVTPRHVASRRPRRPEDEDGEELNWPRRASLFAARGKRGEVSD